jgi:cytochrome b561
MSAQNRKAASLARLKFTFWLDTALLIAVCALQAIHFTGLILHEWLGIAVVPLLLIHLLLAWSWISAETRRFFSSQSIRSRINYLLNLSLFGAVTAATYSGILISQKAIPAISHTLSGPFVDWKWDRLHTWFADITVILVGLHLAINLDWAFAAAQRIFRRLLEGER